MTLTFRGGVPADAPICGDICYRAFKTIAEHHRFPPDFPAVETATGLFEQVLSTPGSYVVVAEEDDRVIGSNVLDERNPIAGVGPITVDPLVQNRGVGRLLMLDVLERAEQNGFPGVRLVQAAFHSRSLSLYARLGFEVREPLACIQGTPPRAPIPGRETRRAVEADREACDALCARVHGHSRGGELAQAIDRGTATVVECDGEITGYATLVGFFGHAIGASEQDLKALIAGSETIAGPGMLVPMRHTGLFRWCLDRELRVVQTMTLMTKGLYNEPAGAFLPSILY